VQVDAETPHKNSGLKSGAIISELLRHVLGVDLYQRGQFPVGRRRQSEYDKLEHWGLLTERAGEDEGTSAQAAFGWTVQE
jgi:hypothetical protein